VAVVPFRDDPWIELEADQDIDDCCFVSEKLEDMDVQDFWYGVLTCPQRKTFSDDITKVIQNFIDACKDPYILDGGIR
jgi:hypothetical protein